MIIVKSNEKGRYCNHTKFDILRFLHERGILKYEENESKFYRYNKNDQSNYF